jgi:hypothetical protein
LDLLEFTRVRSRSLLKTLLETGSTSVDLVDLTWALPTTDELLTLEPARGDPPPAPLSVYSQDEKVAGIASQDHADVQPIIDTGLEFSVELMTTFTPVALRLSLVASETES